MLGRSGSLLTFFSLSQLLVHCWAAESFSWTFGDSVSPTVLNYLHSKAHFSQFAYAEFQECQTLPVLVSSTNVSNPGAIGIPPYYMLAFELGGVPTTSMIGADLNNLQWQVNHARGTHDNQTLSCAPLTIYTGSALMLALVDSKGNNGGVQPVLYNVTGESYQFLF